MNNEKIGRFIAKQRKRRNKTQKEIAELLGVTNKAISKWECGDGYPEITILPALAEILGVTIEELLKGELDGNIYKEEVRSTDTEQDHTSKQADYLLNSSFHRFKNLHMIATGIVILGLLSFFTITLVTLYEVLGFGVQLAFLLTSGMFIYVIYNNLISVVLKYKQLYPDDMTDQNVILDVGKQLRFSMWIGMISLMFSLPYLLFDNSRFTKSILSFDNYVFIVPFFLMMGGVISYYAGRFFLNTFYTKWRIALPAQLRSISQSEDQRSLCRFSLISPLFFYLWFAYWVLLTLLIEMFFGSANPPVWLAVLVLFFPIILYIVYSVRLIVRQTHRLTKVLLNGYIFRDVISFMIFFYGIQNGFWVAPQGFGFSEGVSPMVILFLLFFVGMTLLIEWYKRKHTTANEH